MAGTRDEQDTVQPAAGERCAFSHKYGEHVPEQAVFIGWDEHGTRRIACVPACPRPAAGQGDPR